MARDFDDFPVYDPIIKQGSTYLSSMWISFVATFVETLQEYLSQYGIFIPVLTDDERTNITTPQEGQLVYSSTSKVIYAYLNGSWVQLNTGSSPPASFPWTTITAASQALSVNNGYIANRASLITFTLPVNSSVGDVIKIITENSGNFTVAQNAGQNIRIGNQATSTGVGGSITSTDVGDTIELVCTIANSYWIAQSAAGTFTIV